jgi:hypothetical protein
MIGFTTTSSPQVEGALLDERDRHRDLEADVDEPDEHGREQEEHERPITDDQAERAAGGRLECRVLAAFRQKQPASRMTEPATVAAPANKAGQLPSASRSPPNRGPIATSCRVASPSVVPELLEPFRLRVQPRRRDVVVNLAPRAGSCRRGRVARRRARR